MNPKSVGDRCFVAGTSFFRVPRFGDLCHSSVSVFQLSDDSIPMFVGSELPGYPLVMSNIAIEHGHRNSGFSHVKFGGSFHSYVTLW